jgi:predicted P-loop ATPase
VNKPVKDIWKDLNKEYIDQIWAEALQAVENKESLYFGSAFDILAGMERERFEMPDPWQEAVFQWIDNTSFHEGDKISMNIAFTRAIAKKESLERVDIKTSKRLSKILSKHSSLEKKKTSRGIVYVFHEGQNH